jgi:uncharacterized protein (TIGR04255 family)
MAPYVSWEAFSASLNVAIEGLFDKTEDLVVRRLGLRYINALTAAKHGISSISDLDVSVVVSEETLDGRINLNFTRQVDETKQCTVRLATREFVQGAAFPRDALLVDVDVYTPHEFVVDSSAAVKRWVTEARTSKNDAFFSLLRAETQNSLGVNG